MGPLPPIASPTLEYLLNLVSAQMRTLELYVFALDVDSTSRAAAWALRPASGGCESAQGRGVPTSAPPGAGSSISNTSTPDVPRLPPSRRRQPRLLQRRRERPKLSSSRRPRRWGRGDRRDQPKAQLHQVERADPRFHPDRARVHGDATRCRREIAEAIGRRLNVPVRRISAEEAASHFGWFAHFAQIDSPASSKLTRQRLGWEPRELGLIADLEQSTRYFETSKQAV